MTLRAGCFLAALCLALGARELPTQPKIVGDEDPLQKIASLVIPHGYPLQVYNVKSEDGFILTVLRIPHGLDGAGQQRQAKRAGAGNRLAGAQTDPNPDGKRPVVFLQHGLLDSAAGFLVNGPGRSLAFLLADAGYDVWLGNMRGNSLSRAHDTLDVSDERFWQWSYDEMASYDLPAMIRFALRTAGAPSLRYVGHSQGTTVILAALAAVSGGGRGQSPVGRSGGGAALLPGEVERAVLLAPVAVAKHISSVPLIAMSAMGTDNMFTLLGLHEFLPSQEVVAALEGRLCAVEPYLCGSFLAALCGYNPDNLDNGRIPLYLRFTPAGTSVQNMAHWAQAMRSRAPNSMRFFDYGTDCGGGRGERCNQIMYGSLEPPRYNLTSITTPLALFSGTRDRLSTPIDVEYLVESLGPGVAQMGRILPQYEHLDFIWGIDAKEALYDDVMRFLEGEPQQQQQQQPRQQQQAGGDGEGAAASRQ